MNVLIIEDETAAAVNLQAILRNIVPDCTVLEVLESIEESVEYFKEKNSPTPDLVFMDIIMPVKSGVEALTEIKAFDGSAKVVMASSVGTQENLKEAILAGAYDFLQKPIDNDDVAKIVTKASK